MYAPRMSAGASAATTACEVGTQSISPITKTTITSAITGGRAVHVRGAGTARPSSASRPPSFSDDGTHAVQRVSRSWNDVTSSGLTIIRKPHAAGARWCVVVDRDRQQRLGRDVGHRREHRREHEEQERRVAHDHARTSRAAAALPVRRRRRAGCSATAIAKATAASTSAPSQVRPVPAERAAARRAAGRS